MLNWSGIWWRKYGPRYFPYTSNLAPKCEDNLSDASLQRPEGNQRYSRQGNIGQAVELGEPDTNLCYINPQTNQSIMVWCVLKNYLDNFNIQIKASTMVNMWVVSNQILPY